MTELETIEKAFEWYLGGSSSSQHYSKSIDPDKLRRLLEICKEQNAMLCRFAQDHEAYNQGKSDLAREIEVLMNRTDLGIFTGSDLIKWLKERTDPSTLRPDYEEALDKLWEAKKAMKLLEDYIRAFEHAHVEDVHCFPLSGFERDILVRLLNLLTS